MIGEHLGNWVIYKELGRGGMGRVYLAQEEMSGRRAAIKVLAAELAQEAGFLHRFQQEIDALSKLTHPGIVRFYESGFESGVHYYVMEYVEGESLERVLERKKRLPWRDVLDIALQVCPALKHAHDHGIIHRDLKPSNLLQTAEGVIKLTDFGIAKVFAGGHLTATGNIVGTVEYISPEQAAGKPVTKRSDLYSFGIVLYVLLTGRQPFTGKGALDLLYKHQYGQFDPPQSLVLDLPYEINDLVCQLMEKDPDKRPPDCLVLMRQLQKIRDKLEQKSQRTSEWSPSGRTVADAGDTEGDEELRAEGPATFMSRMVRSELERQNRGGPVAQFFNHPVVLVLGLLLCIGGIAYALWPPSAATLYQRGEALMQSGRVSDMETAFASYFDPLDERFPDHPYQEQLEEYRQQLEKARRERDHPALSIVEPLFRRAQRLHQEGDIEAAKKIWTGIVQVFDGVSSEESWVERSRAELKALAESQTGTDRWHPLRQALKRAAQLREQGKHQEAENIRQSIEQLYGDNPEAAAILNEGWEKRKKDEK